MARVEEGAGGVGAGEGGGGRSCLPQFSVAKGWEGLWCEVGLAWSQCQKKRNCLILSTQTLPLAGCSIFHDTISSSGGRRSSPPSSKDIGGGEGGADEMRPDRLGCSGGGAAGPLWNANGRNGCVKWSRRAGAGRKELRLSMSAQSTRA